MSSGSLQRSDRGAAGELGAGTRGDGSVRGSGLCFLPSIWAVSAQYAVLKRGSLVGSSFVASSTFPLGLGLLYRREKSVCVLVCGAVSLSRWGECQVSPEDFLEGL